MASDELELSDNWACNFIINNLIIIKFTYPNIISKDKHEFHQLNSQQSLFTNKHLWVLSRKEIIQKIMREY